MQEDDRSSRAATRVQGVEALILPISAEGASLDLDDSETAECSKDTGIKARSMV